MNRIVHVKKEHIEAGNPGSPESCPVALALFDEFQGYPSIEAGHYMLCIDDNSAKTPMEVSEFMTLYDGNPDSDKIKPFSFLMCYWNI